MSKNRSISTKQLEQTSDVVNSQIQLPDDYTNPLQLVDQIEGLLKFTNKSYNSLPNQFNSNSTEKVNCYFF